MAKIARKLAKIKMRRVWLELTSGIKPITTAKNNHQEIDFFKTPPSR
jgi:hypothetical protein